MSCFVCTCINWTCRRQRINTSECCIIAACTRHSLTVTCANERLRTLFVGRVFLAVAPPDGVLEISLDGVAWLGREVSIIDIFAENVFNVVLWNWTISHAQLLDVTHWQPPVDGPSIGPGPQHQSVWRMSVINRVIIRPSRGTFESVQGTFPVKVAAWHLQSRL